MLGLTPLGTIHTTISLIAVAAGVITLIRDGTISPRNLTGKTYIVTTALTCLTGFGIFQHGGFGVPHMLGIITLLVLGIAAVAGATRVFRGASAYIETVSYSATLFFHMIPATVETATRFPPAAPLAAGPDDPGVQAVIGVFFLLFLIGATLQVLRLRAAHRQHS